MKANGCTCENEENEVRGKLKTIGEAILTCTIELQALFDKSHMSTCLQHQILRFLFDSRLGNIEEVSDLGKLSLGELLILKSRRETLDLAL